MRTITITVGWTRSAMPDYSSFSDGWKRGASQHTEQLTIRVPDKYDDSQICESVFYATNAPDVARWTIAWQVLKALTATGYNGKGAHYSLSVGDTVTIGGTRYACESSGWRIAERYADLTDEDLIALTRDPDPVTARLAELAYAERDTTDNERMFRLESRDS